MPPAKIKRRHIKQGYLDENAGFYQARQTFVGNANF
jgi:hypothetical protein